MIDKLPEYTAQPYPNYPTYEDLINKINELVEAYNKLLENGIDTECHINGKYVKKRIACLEMPND